VIEQLALLHCRVTSENEFGISDCAWSLGKSMKYEASESLPSPEDAVLLFGTTIVVIRTPVQIVIAADSLSSSEGLIRLRQSKCKIIPIRGTWFASAGISANTKRTFDVQQIAKRYCRKNSPINNLRIFAKAINGPLIEELTRLRQTDRATYEKKVNSRERVVLQTLFAGLERGELTTATADFIATHTDPKPITLKVEFSTCPPQCDQARALIALGHRDNIASFLKRGPNLSRIDDHDLAEQMITLEIDHVEVEGPIDILLITKRGANWLRRKKECK
jgi:hypothetical protein